MTHPDAFYIFRQAVKPPEQLSITQWAEKHIYLSTRQATGFPGYYRSNLTPYVRGIFDALQDVTISRVTVEKGAQTGLTLAGYIWLCRCMVEDAGPILLVYPSEAVARSASETRLMPMIEDSPILREEMPEDRDEWTKLQYRMKRATVNWVGSNSPANLASRPVRYLFLDEVDKYPVDNQTEGSPIALAEQRTKTFWNRKIFKISTPTVPEGAVHSCYIAGDQRRFYVPCWKCGEMQFLTWSQVKWPEGKPEEACYECNKCGAKWNESKRDAAVLKGEWRATAVAKDKSHGSFHLSSLYSLWTKFGRLAERFVRAKAYPNELQDFINSELGEPFIHYDNSIRDSEFIQLEGNYAELEKWTDAKPYKEFYIAKERWTLGGVDVQKGYLVSAFREFVQGGDSGLIYAAEIANFDTLEELANKTDPKFILMDNRYRTQEVNDWCAEHIGYIPTQGVTRHSSVVFSIVPTNIDEGTRNQKEGRVLEVIHFNPDAVKDILADVIQRRHKKWLIPDRYSAKEAYCRQMTAEKNINGKWQAIPAGRPNHFWDAEVLCLLGAIRFGIWESHNMGVK